MLQARVLLASTKAAGMGLNVTCACRAVILDVWWNGAFEDQVIACDVPAPHRQCIRCLQVQPGILQPQVPFLEVSLDIASQPLQVLVRMKRVQSGRNPVIHCHTPVLSYCLTSIIWTMYENFLQKGGSKSGVRCRQLTAATGWGRRGRCTCPSSS